VEDIMKKLLLGLGTLSLAILPVAAMVSCSTESTNKVEGNITPQKYEVLVEQSTEIGHLSPTANIITPPRNINALNMLMDKFKGMTVELLQKDFDSVITPLFLVNQEKVETPVKIIENGIKVTSIQSPTPGMEGTEGGAILSVSYTEGDSSEVKTKEGIF
jgi:hypothetical protein